MIDNASAWFVATVRSPIPLMGNHQLEASISISKMAIETA